MMSEFKALLDKKKKEQGQADPMRKKAQMDVLSELRGVANDAIGGNLKDLKKVTVASDSKEGLVSGLEKAEDMLESDKESSEMEDSEDESEDESGDSPLGKMAKMMEMLSPEEKMKLMAMCKVDSSEEDMA